MAIQGDGHSFEPDEGNTRLLRDAFGRFATGVTIVTTANEDGVIAITANSFSTVSLSPPLVLWSPDRQSRRFPHFERARHYAIHVLSADQGALCWDIARDAYGLRKAGLTCNDEGIPVIDGCLARFDCEQTAVHDGGDHAIVLGRVLRASLREDGDALTFFKGRIGHVRLA